VKVTDRSTFEPQNGFDSLLFEGADREPLDITVGYVECEVTVWSESRIDKWMLTMVAVDLLGQVLDSLSRLRLEVVVCEG
jgi:hypothetical protein